MRALARRARAAAGVAAVMIGMGVGADWASAQPVGSVQLSAGDIAIVGRVNNGTTGSNDHISIVALAPLPAGAVIYFTDDGWQTSGSFRTNEGVRKLTVINAIARGRVIRSSDTHADFTWTLSGAWDLAPTGDQIYAFQASSDTNPRGTFTRHLFVLDDTGAFESATNANTGAIPPGLSIAGGTAITLSAFATTNLRSTAALASGTKGQWLTAISTVANWGAGPIPSSNLVVNPYTQIVDATATGAATNGTLASNEYGSGNLMVFSGGGNGFGGTLGYGSIYMDSDGTNLYIGFQPGNTANDVVVLYFDTAGGGQSDATMADSASTDRNVISNLGQAGNDLFPFAPDYALSIWNSPAPGSPDGFLYRLFPGGDNSHQYYSGTSASPIDAGTQRVFREFAIPLTELNLAPGSTLKMFAAVCSDTLFNSNETVPPMSAINGAANPGQTSTVTYDAYCEFNVYCETPVVTAQPQSQIVGAGTDVTLSVTATGTLPVYQWRRNGVNLSDGGRISGATTDTLTISNAFVSDTASYDCVVNVCGSVTSSAAVLTVGCLDPDEVAHLIGTSPTSGDQVGYSVAISGDTMVVGAPEYDSGLADAGGAYVFVRSGGVWTQQARLLASDRAPSDFFGASVDISGDTIAVGAYSDSFGGATDAGSVYVFVRSGTTWTEQGTKLTASDRATNDHFGISVGIDGDTIVVGAVDDAHSAQGNPGSAYIFTRTSGVWTQQQMLIASDPQDNDDFGRAVAISGNTVVIGADYEDTGGLDAGAAYVFTRSGSTWAQQQKLMSADLQAGDDFGYAVDISGDTIIVGADMDDTSAGAEAGSAYIFTRSGSVWTQQTQLVGATGTDADYFGNAVSLLGNNAAVGAISYDWPGAPGSGAVYIYSRSDVTWTQRSVVTASDIAGGDGFGRGVAITADTLGVGSYTDDTPGGEDIGSAYVYDITDDSAVITQQPVAATGWWGGSASFSVVLSGGSPTFQWRKNGVNLSNGAHVSGATSATLTLLNLEPDQVGSYDCVVTSYCGTALTSSSAALALECFSPVQIANMVAASGAAADNFGFFVAVSGDTIVVGSPDNLASRGTVYVYLRSGGSVTQQQQISASDGAAGDWFGSSVSISGNTLVVGAPRDDTTVTDAGSAYVYTRSGSTWSQQQKLVASDPASGDDYGTAVSIDGDVIAVGAYDKPGGGALYMYNRSGSTWTQQSKVVASDHVSDDQFGIRVAVRGETVLVGADNDDAGRGGAYIVTRSGTTWTQQAKLVASDGVPGDGFGSAVALTSGMALVGASSDDTGAAPDAGAAYVFTGSGATWTQQAKVVASDPATSEAFGTSVAMLGTTLAIGAYKDNAPGGAQSGAVYLFTWNGSAWTQQTKLVASNGAPDDNFGMSVGLTSDLLAVGAWKDDTAGGADAGSAYAFDLTGDFPTIGTQPAAVTVCTPAAINVAVTASGTSLTYQWRKDGVDLSNGGRISGATSAALAITPSITSDAGSYDCVITSTCGTTTSSAAAVTVNTPTSVATAPVGGTACTGTSFTFTTVAGGTGPFTYQWFRGATPVGTNSASYAIASAVAGDAGSYTVQITGACGTATSSAVSLVVNTSVSFTLQPVAVTTCEGTGVTLTSAAAGTGPISYQWYRNGNIIAGATSATYTIASALPSLSGTHFVRATGACGPVDSTSVPVVIDATTTVTSQPATTYVMEGASAYLSVGVQGASLTFQWRKDGVNLVDGGRISGATAATLVIASADGSDRGTYACAVSGTCGPGVTSSDAELLILCAATPWVGNAVHPSDPGANDHFSVVAISGDTMIVGAPDDDDGGTDAGSAYVFVRDGNGVWTQQAKLVTSNQVAGRRFGASVALSGNTAVIGKDAASTTLSFVFVRSGTTWTEQASITGGQGPGNVGVSGDTCAVGVPDDSAGRGLVRVYTRSGTTWVQQATLTPADSTAGDAVGSSVAIVGDVIVVGASGDDVSSGATYVFTRTGTTWTEQAKLTATTRAAGDEFGSSVAMYGETVVVGAPMVGATDTGAAYTFVRSGTSWSQQAALSPPAASAVGHFGASVAAGSEQVIVGQPGGNRAAVFTRSGTTWGTGTTVLPVFTSAEFGSSVAMSGSNAVVGSYSASSGAGEVAPILIATTLPVITDEPDAVAVCLGASATFSVSGTSETGTVTQWRRDGVVVGGASYPGGSYTDSFTVSSVTAGDAGSYDVVVLNSCGEVTSASATLTINPVTSIATNPVGGNICTGGIVLLTVTADGAGPFSYQWFRDGVVPVGGNSPQYGATTQGSYTVRVTGACGPAVTSSPVTVNVNPPTSIATAPVGGTVCQGGSFTFHVVAGGVAPFQYVWKRGTTVVGGDSPSLTIASAVPGDAGSYTVQVTGNCGSVATSSPVSLGVNPTTSITTQPSSVTDFPGGSATFSVVASGSSLTYQWRKDGVSLVNGGNIAGATGATLTVSALTILDEGGYDCVVSGACGQSTTSPATLDLACFSTGDFTHIVPSDGAATNYFGSATAASGDTVVVGASGVGSGEGAVSVYVRDGSAWTRQAVLTASDATSGQNFGVSVGISGDTVVVGTVANAAYVFVRSGTTWSQQAKLTTSDGLAGAGFGGVVAISSDSIITGAAGADIASFPDAGAAYILTRSGTVWTQQAKLTASDLGAGDIFGNAVDITGDTAVIGAPQDTHSSLSLAGSTYVFVRSGSTWSQQAKLIAADPGANDLFGSSVTISGESVLIGAPQDDLSASNTGSAYVFTRSGATWTQQARLNATDRASNDVFGTRAAISGNIAVIGSPSADLPGAVNAGASYVFIRSGGVWTQNTKLSASSPGADDSFGGSVAVTNTWAVAGSPVDDTPQGSNAGSAHIFSLSGSAPTISDEPDALVACDAGSATFTASVTGSNLVYRWRKDGVDLDNGGTISGATSASLTINPVSAADEGSYDLVVVGPCGSVTSTAADLTVTPTATIVSEPQDGSACYLTSHTFSVVAQDAVSYLWTRNGTPVGTDSTYTISEAQPSDDGTYVVTVFSACGQQVASTPVTFTTLPHIASPQASGGGHACFGSSRTFTASVQGAAPFQFEWRRDGQFVYLGESFTIPSVTFEDSGEYVVYITTQCGTAVVSAGTLSVSTPTTIVTGPVNFESCQQFDFTFTVDATGGNLQYQWFLDGVPMGVNAPSFRYVPSPIHGLSAQTYPVTVRVSGDCGPPVMSSPASAIVHPRLYVASWTPSVSTCEGQTATFQVTVADGTELIYDWYKDGSAVDGDGRITGAKSPILTINSATPADMGNYRCLVRARCGPPSLTSDIPLTVTPATIITVDPEPVSQCEGGAAAFSVSVTGDGTITYQWFRGATPVGGNTPTLSINPVTPADAGSYTVQVTSGCGVLTSSAASLDVAVSPFISVYPSDATACVGAPVSVSVTAAGTGPLQYSWFVDSELVGVTTVPMFTFNMPSAASVLIAVSVSNACGAASSPPATITASPTTSITAQPSPVSATPGSTATFTVGATGSGLSYQWRKDGVPLADLSGQISGSTTAILTLLSVSEDDEGQYDCEVDGDCGDGESSPAGLNIDKKGGCFAADQTVQLLAADGAVNDSLGYSVAIAGDTAIVGAYTDDTSGGFNTGSAYVFTRTGGVWTQQGHLIASDGAVNDLYGLSVAVAGDTAIVGSPRDDTSGGADAGSVYVFTRTAGAWSQQAKLTASDGAGDDQFGISVSISGDTVVIGAYADDTSGGFNAGSAYVFTRTAGVWSQQSKLTAGDGAANDNFGGSITISGDTAIVGSRGDDTAGGSEAGSAYVFTRTGGVWTQQAKLTASDGAPSESFGCVALSGDTAVISARFGDTPAGADTGSAYIFTRTAGVWTEQAKLIASDALPGNQLGTAVALSGDTVVLGAYAVTTPGGAYAGAAYVFTRTAGVWTEQAKMTAADSAADDYFGFSVALAGSTAVIGAFQDDTTASNAGSAYVFDLTVNTGPTITDEPDALSACDGSSASFTVVATGDGLSYQWYFNGDPLVDGGEVSGATTDTLTIAPVGELSAGDYTCVVTNSCGEATSSTATLTVGPNAVIVSGPADATACSLEGVSFTVEATGTNLQYQWFIDGNPVPDFSEPTLVFFPDPTETTVYALSVQVSGDCGPPLMSTAASFTVYPLRVVEPVSSVTACEASPAVFHVSATGFELVYVWQKDGEDLTDDDRITGAGTATLTINNVLAADAGSYRCIVDDYCGTPDFTNTATLTVKPVTQVTSQPTSASAPAASQVSFEVDAAGAGLSYRWKKYGIMLSDGGNIAGAQTRTLTISALTEADEGPYVCVVTGECGEVPSSPANLDVQECTPPTTAYVDDNYAGLPDGTVVSWPFDGGTGSYVIGCDAFADIQSGLDAVVASTVYVAAGSYVQDLLIDLDNTNLIGDGAAVTFVYGTMNQGDSATIRIAANNVTVTGLTISREGNNPTDWDSNLNTAGIAIQGLAVTGALIHDNIITGNRTGIDLNNTGGHTVRNNVINNNRTGVIFRNTTDATTFTENFVTNNWTAGVLFLDGSTLTNVPAQSFSGSFRNNNISGNWYAQIEDRQSGGSLPAPGTTNLKNFSSNWLGSVSPVISNASGGEPGYSGLIPFAFGGSAVPPGGQPDVKGAAVDNFDITPYLHVATDTNVSTGNGTFGFQGEFKELDVTSRIAQTGATTRIQEGHDEVAVVSGASVYVSVGTFTENVTVTKTLRIDGTGSGAGGFDCPAADPLTHTVVTAALPGEPVFFINAATDVTLTKMYITGASGSTDSTAAGVRVWTDTGGSYGDYRFAHLTVSGNSGPGIVFDGEGSILSVEADTLTLCSNRIGVLVDDDMPSFIGLELDTAYVAENVFNGLSVMGAADGSVIRSGIRVSGSFFSRNGQSSDAFQGSGDLSFFYFNGKADIDNTLVDSVGRFPIQFRGAGNQAIPGTWLPMGEVSLQSVQVTGAADRAALYIHIYADVDDLSLSDVDLDNFTNTNPPFSGFSVGGMVLAHAGAAPLALNDTQFPCQGTGYVGLGNFFTGGATADCTTSFAGAFSLANKELCVYDFNDNPAVGDVTFDDIYFPADPAGGTFCPGSTVILSADAAGAGPLTYRWWFNNSPLDEVAPYSGTLTDTLTIAPAGVAQSGNYVLVVTNACGAVGSATAAVSISDSSPPSITCGPDQFANADASCVALVPDFIASTTISDGCGIASVTQFPPAGSPVGVGTHPVTVTVTDIGGNINSCTADFTVSDVTPPVISACAPDQNAFANASCSALVPDFTASVTASDACGGITVTQSPVAGTPVGLGTTVVTITVTDGASLTATCAANFNVTDNTPPTISTCAADQTISAGSGCFVNLPDLTGQIVANDNCTPGGGLLVTQAPPAGTLIAVGVTTVTFTVTDATSNSSTCTASITVTGGGAQAVTYVDDDYVGLPDGTVVTWPAAGGSGAYTIGCQAFATIQRGVNNVTPSGLVNVAAGTYAEDVLVNKPGVTVAGVDAGLTMVHGVPGGDSATVRLAATNVHITGLTITRQGNNLAQWNSPALNTAGVAAQGAAAAGSSVTCCIITANRTGVDINNSNSITIENCDVVNNRTGVIFRNVTDNCSISYNRIADNWTVGVLFLDSAPGPQSADGTVISHNTITGNWYAAIQDRMTTVDLKNFSTNFFGVVSDSLTISPVNTTEPGYAALIPVEFGGSAVPPGSAPCIAGVGSSNIDFNPYLAIDTDTSPACGFQPDLSRVWVTTRLAQTGVGVGRVQEGHDATIDNGTIYAEAGDYADNVTITKSGITLNGANSGICTSSLTERNPESVLTPAFADATLDMPLIYVTASGLTIDGFTLDADNPALTSGVLVGSADSDTDNLVANGSFDDFTTYPFIHVNSITLTNNILRSANDVAVNLYNDDAFPVSTDNDISCNWFDNLQGVNTLSGGYDRIGVLLYNDTYAAVDDNEMTDVRIGIQNGNNFRANPGAPASIIRNIVSAEITGIWHNLHYVDASTWTIADNDVTHSLVSADAFYAIAITSVQSAVSVTVSGNDVSDAYAGFFLWNNTTTNSVTISGGSAINCESGIRASDLDVNYGFAVGPTRSVADSIAITTPDFSAGVLVANYNGSTVTVVLSNITQTGTATSFGVLVDGPLGAARIDDSSFTGNSIGVYVNVGRAAIESCDLSSSSSACILGFVAAAVDAGNCAGVDITGLGASSGGNTLTGSTFNNNFPFAAWSAYMPSAPFYAQNNAFGASLGDDIELAIFDDDDDFPSTGPVLFSQSGALLATCLADITVQCVGNVPPGITTSAGYEAAGMVVSASDYTVEFSDAGTLVNGEGIITRTYTLTDACGPVAVCTQTITVDDTTAPVISSCAPAQAAFADTLCSALVPDFTAGVVATDNCGGALTISQSPLAGTPVTLGVHPITITVNDGHGNPATCSTTFSVTDNTPPAVSTCAPDAAASANASCQALVPDFTSTSTFTDNCDSSLVLTQSPAAGTPVGLGITVVTITAADDAGNTGSCTANFTVSDTTPPAINACAGDQSASADANCLAAVPDFTALSSFADNCDPSLTVTQSPLAGTPVGLGTTVVTITATDDANNSIFCTANFNVTDTTAPTITTCAPAQAAFANASCSALVPDFTASTVAADNCTIASITQSPIAGTPVGLGVTNISITVTDGAGLTALCSTTFTVTDNSPPSISVCAPPLSLVAAGLDCEAVLPDLTALVLASDNCDGTVVVTQSPVAGTVLGVGAHTITFTVTDDASNAATCDTLVTVNAPSVLFVDKDATGSNDGSSWTNAYADLQDALAAMACVGSGEIWVADGTYHPDRATADRNDTFAMLNNVAIYGGFNATETLLSQRDPDANITILSGDIGAPGVHSDNSYAVVTASGTDPTAILDGFTVTRGNAGPSGTGAGIFMQKGSPTIANCLFTLNQAFRGGAAFAEDSAPAFIRCTFLANSATDGGGAIRSVTSAIDVVNARFLGNTANFGAAVYNTAASDSTFTNCVFSGNAAANAGGAVYNNISSLATLTNCTISLNTANTTGGVYTTGLASQASLASSILWNNSDSGGVTENAQYRAVSNGAVAADYCDIQLLTASLGAGNISVDPDFVDPDGADSSAGTLDDDYRPMPGSPVIDAGSNPALPADTYDLDADLNTAEPLPVDLASYPRRLDEPSVSDTGLGSAPIVDMGAYEFDCTAVDCNENGTCDSVDIALGGSSDCFNPATPPNGGGFYAAGGPDGIPDECQCVADWNRDGIVNSTDVSEFVNTYFDDQVNATTNGDINCNGVSNSTDVSDFINIWFEENAALRPYSGCTI